MGSPSNNMSDRSSFLSPDLDINKREVGINDEEDDELNSFLAKFEFEDPSELNSELLKYSYKTEDSSICFGRHF